VWYACARAAYRRPARTKQLPVARRHPRLRDHSDAAFDRSKRRLVPATAERVQRPSRAPEKYFERKWKQIQRRQITLLSSCVRIVRLSCRVAISKARVGGHFGPLNRDWYQRYPNEINQSINQGFIIVA